MVLKTYFKAGFEQVCSLLVTSYRQVRDKKAETCHSPARSVCMELQRTDFYDQKHVSDKSQTFFC